MQDRTPSGVIKFNEDFVRALKNEASEEVLSVWVNDPDVKLAFLVLAQTMAFVPVSVRKQASLELIRDLARHHGVDLGDGD